MPDCAKIVSLLEFPQMRERRTAAFAGERQQVVNCHLADPTALYEYFWPARDASYINPPFATVNAAIPL